MRESGNQSYTLGHEERSDGGREAGFDELPGNESGRVQVHDIVGLLIGGGSRLAQKPKVCRALTHEFAKALSGLMFATRLTWREAELDSSLLHRDLWPPNTRHRTTGLTKAKVVIPFLTSMPSHVNNFSPP